MNDAGGTPAAEPGMMLTTTNLGKTYGGTAGLINGIRDVNISVRTGEFFTLLGPSGCGKTTTLRSIAGLEEPNAGQISIGDQTVFDASRKFSLPISEREIGMVFQSYAVWPHMTVFDNAAYPLRYGRYKSIPRSDLRRTVMGILEIVGLEDYADRPAPKLSGGQQQRLALARALVGHPKLLLLDEPLSNLDAALRDQMRREIRQLQQKTGLTAIYVTHDQSEALAMSDRIAVMNAGRVEQIADPRTIYSSPASRFVAGFIGLSSVIQGTITQPAKAGEDVVLQTSFGKFHGRAMQPISVGRVEAVVRPEDFAVLSENGAPSGRENTLQGRLMAESFFGEVSEYEVALGETMIAIRARNLGAGPDRSVMLSVPTEAVKVYGAEASA